MLELKGHITEAGSLRVFNEPDLRRWLNANRGKEIVLSLKAYKKTRSNEQNRYYWGVMIPMVQEAMNSFGNDYSKEETHEFLKKEFHWEEKEMKEGYYVKVPRSTTKMTTIDFMDYKEKIQVFASEILGIYIPDPMEQTKMKF